MQKYYCESCNYDAKQKSNYLKHLKTKKHLERMKNYYKVTPKSPFSHHLVTIESPQNHPKVTITTSDTTTNNLKTTNILKNEQNICKYCQKSFKYKQGMYRHIKYTCKKNKDEDLIELVRLLNETKAENEKMKKQIEKLTKKLQIQNVNLVNNNWNNTQTNLYNIQLLNHDKTDYTHLTSKDYMKCITDCNHCVKTLIEKVHFNPKKPENHNIYISNIKNNYIMLYKDGQWNIVDRKYQIDDLYEFNELVLEQWYDENKEKNPELIKSFERYLQNKMDTDNTINDVKHQILLLLYNKRNMIEPGDIPDSNFIILEEK